MNFIKNKKRKAVTAADNNERFLDHKRKKTWEDSKSGQKCKCFMLYARSLYITSGASDKWVWNSFKHTSDENIELAKLSHACWLDVRGKFKMSDLSSETLYEVVYDVRLSEGASGWELPINLRLSLPNGTVKERQISLFQKPRGEWIELNVGKFRTGKKGESSETQEVCFDLYEHGSHWKHGLVVRSAILRPKTLK